MTFMYCDNQVGNRIRQSRANLGWSQADLAKLCGIAPTQFSRYESGKALPRPETLVKIAEALNVTDEWLARGTGSIDRMDPNPPALPGEEIMSVELPLDLAERIKKRAEAKGRTVEMEIIQLIGLSMEMEKAEKIGSESPLANLDLDALVDLDALAEKVANKLIIKDKTVLLRPLGSDDRDEAIRQANAEINKSLTPTIPGVNAPKRGIGASKKKKPPKK